MPVYVFDAKIMYHSAKLFTIRKLAAFAYLALTTACSSAAFADPRVATGTLPLAGNLSFVSSEVAALPAKKQLKERPNDIQIYQYDQTPLGDRSPFLLVHGLRGEYYPTFRWQKLIENFTKDDQFDSHYKVYLARYDSLDRLSNTIPQFRKAIANLSRNTQSRPISVMALSIGGNLVYESMRDKDTDKAIQLVMSLGTPFHGSPLFCEDWLQYSIYKNLAFPWTRVDHGIDYRLYFHYNSMLQKDLKWDNTDGAIPDIGHFHSLLPLGPHGDLTVLDTLNTRLADINRLNFEKKKLITYGGYLVNPYMLNNPARTIETTAIAPYRFFATKIPAHLGREHPVLRLLNREIGSIRPTDAVRQKEGTKFIYQLNDGIAPVSSALFLPGNGETPTLVREKDLAGMKKVADVRLARVFRNIDHLSFIDGFRPFGAPSKYHDQLDLQAGSKSLFGWMLSDLNDACNSSNQLAREQRSPDVVPDSTQ